MSDINKEQLQTELFFVDNELAAERQKGSNGDSGKIAQLEQKRADINYQLESINKAVKEQAIEEKVHSEIAFAIPGVDFTSLPPQLITVIEKVVKADRRRIYAEHAVELDQVENEYDEYKQNAEGNYNGLHANYSKLELDYETCARELREQGEETVRVIAERDDARKNRDNAVRQLEELRAENDRLKSEVDDYQKAKVFGERESHNVIDVTPNEADEINAAIKQFLKSEDWGSIIKVTKPDATFELVQREEFNNEWQPILAPTLGGGETATETFQSEVSQADATDCGIPDTEASNVTPSEETAVQADSVPGEMAEQKNEIIRRLERLEVAVFGQGRVA